MHQGLATLIQGKTSGGCASPKRQRARSRPAVERLECRELLNGGTFDPSFGARGTATASFGGIFGSPPAVEATAIQPDGKILVAGHVKGGGFLGLKLPQNADIGIARFLPNGQLDKSFGFGGKATVNFGTNHKYADVVSSIAVDSAGRIVIAGTGIRTNGRPEIIVDRLKPNGAYDKTFGIAGRSYANFDALGSTGVTASGMVLDNQGRIIVAGTVLAAGGQNEFGVIRLTTTGYFDPTFGNQGRSIDLVAIPDFNQDSVASVNIDNIGRIVVAGTVTALNGPTSEFAVGVLCLTPDGNADPTFGNTSTGYNRGTFQGFYVGPFQPAMRAVAIVVDSQDRLVVAGDSDYYNNTPSFMVTRITSQGRLDTSFANQGFATINYAVQGSSHFDVATGAMLDGAGNIVVTGFIVGGSEQAAALVRLLPSGALDTTFGNGGAFDANFGLGNDAADAIASDSNGNIVIATTEFVKGGPKFGVARVLS